MNTFYYLSTCDTCKRIMKTILLPASVRIQDIKSDPITEVTLEILRDLAGSYEALFSKRARLYKERNLKDANLQESDFRDLLLEHYTFLKRPVLIFNGSIFIGNSAKTVATTTKAIHNS